MSQRSRSRTSRGRGPDSIVKNTASSFVAQMTTAALTAVLTVFLVRALGARQYGLFALTLGISSIAIAFADFGISSSTSRFVAEHRGRDAELRALITDALKLKVIITSLACALLAALASVIAGAYGNPELVWPLRAIALATFGQSTYLMLLGISTALGRTIVNVRLVAAESLLEILSSIALVLAGAGAAGAAFGRAIGFVLGAVIAAGVVLGLGGDGLVGFWRLPRRATVRQVGGYAGPVFAIDVSFTLSSSLSVLFLGAYAGSAASGMFQAPMKLIVLLQYVGLSTAAGVTPRLTRGPGQEPDVQALNGALRGLIGFQCLLLAPAVLWAGPITHVLLGAGYSRSADVLAALAPYIFFSGLAPLVTLAVNYMGEAGRRVPIALATLALVVAGGFILIPSHGVVGAAIATDIAFGFYTLAHIWICRRLLKLRIGMLLWSLACGLTAAATMGIVLESVGTRQLTVLDWLVGGAGGLTAFIAMLIFTREIRGAQIAHACVRIGTLLTLLRLSRGRRRTPGPAMLPLRPEAAAATRVSIAGADKPQGRDELVVGADATRSAPTSVLRRRRHRPAVARPVVPSRPQRSPAAYPPSWLGQAVGGEPVPPSSLGARAPTDGADAALPDPQRHDPSPAEPVAEPGERGARTAADADNSERPLPPAAQPPSWLSDRRASGQAGEGASAVVEDTQRQSKAPEAWPDPGRTSSARTDPLYQIAWRLGVDAGVFELRAVEPADPSEVPDAEQSPSVPWGWRMAPPPTPEARLAHQALVDRLLVARWQPAGPGDTWFGDRFRPPESAAKTDVPVTDA